MKARTIVSTALFAILCVSGCNSGGKDSSNQVKSTAPQKSVKETESTNQEQWAELIVGKWEAVRMNGHDIDPLSKVTIEFSRDGKFITLVDTMRPTTENSKTGSYILNKNVLQFATPANGDIKERKWEAIIEYISEYKLILVNGMPPDLERDEFKRAKPNK